MKGAERLYARVKEFSYLTPELRRELAEASRVERYLLGQVIFSEGQPGDRFCVVHSGRVRIVKQAGGSEVSLATLGANQSFGEIALVRDVPRTATARAAAKTTLITVQRDVFLSVLEKSPGLREFYQRQIEDRTFKAFLQALTSFGRGLSGPMLQRLSGQAQHMRLAAGEALELRDDALYVLASGELGVVRTRAGRSATITRVKPGETVGADRLVGERHFDYEASEECELYLLGPKALQTLRSSAEDFPGYLEARQRRWRRLADLDFVEEQQLEGEHEDPEDVTDQDAAGADETGFLGGLPLIRRRLAIARFPFVAQGNPLECGVATMSMLARFFDLKLESNRIAAMARPRATGQSLEPLADVAERLGFHARVAPASYDLLLSSDLPLVVHWDKGSSYAIVYRVSKQHVWLADPAHGLRRFRREAFLRRWNGMAMFVELAPKVSSRSGGWVWLRFARYLKPHRGLLLQLGLASLVLQLLGLATPKFTELIVDRVVVHKDLDLLHVILLGMLLITGGALLVSAVRTYIMAHIGRRISFAMLRNFYAHMLRLPLSWFGSRSSGDLVQRFQDNEEIKELMMGQTLGVALDCSLVVVYLGAMLAYSPALTGVSLLTVLPMIVLTFAQAPINMRFDRLQFDADAAEDATMIEAIHGAETIKTLGMERQVYTKWEEALARKLNLDWDQAMFGIGIGSLSQVFHHAGTLLVLWLGAHAVIEGKLTMGQLMAFLALSQHVFDPLLNLVGVVSEVQEAQVALERLSEVFDSEPEEEPGTTEAVELSHVEGNIVFEDVRFRYDADGPWILNGVSCELPAGQTLAIVGRSGSGKSTLAKLLLRHHKPDGGRILLDGVDIAQVSPTSLRRAVGSILQKPFLFNATIRENITLDHKVVDTTALERCAKLAAAHDFIEKMPLGYNSMAGEGGASLSGGQRQRISIARALYRDPRVFVMDEATSALDTESEVAIQQNMLNFLDDRTAVVIAHRMSTIRHADKIVVLDEGRIVEEGDHRSLMELGGLYYHLCTKQAGG